MDTSDTGDTSAEAEEHIEIISAAEQAGETGGFSCSSFGIYSPFLLIIPLIALYFRNKK